MVPRDESDEEPKKQCQTDRHRQPSHETVHSNNQTCGYEKPGMMDDRKQNGQKVNETKQTIPDSGIIKTRR